MGHKFDYSLDVRFFFSRRIIQRVYLIAKYIQNVACHMRMVNEIVNEIEKKRREF